MLYPLTLLFQQSDELNLDARIRELESAHTQATKNATAEALRTIEIRLAVIQAIARDDTASPPTLLLALRTLSESAPDDRKALKNSAVAVFLKKIAS